MSKRVVLYARVSTDEQADKGYSLPSQLEACRNYAETHNFTVVGDSYYDLHTGLRVVKRNGVWQFADRDKAARLGEGHKRKPIEPALGYVDDYTGTVPIEQRPEGRKAYEMLKSGHADALIAYTVDRLVRPPEEGDEWEMPLLIRGLARLGKELHVVNRGKLETSFAGLLIAMLDAKSAGDERRKIIERTMRGMNSKARAGKVVGKGMPTYGYQFVYDDNKRVMGLAIVDSEGKIVKLIYHWYVLGDENGDPMTAYAIARKLSEMKIPTPSQGKDKRKRAPHLWNDCTINRILQNETYAGCWRYGKEMGKHGKGGKRPIEEQIAVSVPAIIERELWEAAHRQLEHNKRMSRRNCNHEYLIRSMGKCGECGFALSGWVSNRQSLYYRCSQKSSHFPGLEHICRQKMVRADVLETKVWGYILDLWSNKKRFVQILRDAQKAELNSLQPKRERLAAVQSLIDECKHEATRIARAMERIGEDPNDMVWQNLEHDRKEVQQRHHELVKEHDELLLAVNSRQLTDERIKAALKQREDVVVGMKKPTFEGKRRLLELLQVLVTVRDGKAWIKSIAPVPPTPIDLQTPRSL